MVIIENTNDIWYNVGRKAVKEYNLKFCKDCKNICLCCLCDKCSDLLNKAMEKLNVRD